MDASLPGADLVRKGLDDLAHGVESVESLLVSIGAPRLQGVGILVQRAFSQPEHRLYALLAREDSNAAHSRYHALIRRLVSFEHAAECVNPQTCTEARVTAVRERGPSNA